MSKCQLGLWTASLFLVSGCLVTRSELREGEGRRENQDQVTTYQKAAANDRERVVERQVVVERPVPTDSSNRMGELEGSIRELNGRLEVVENKLGQHEQAKSKNTQALEEQVNESNRKVALLQEEVAKLSSQVQALAEQAAQEATTHAEKEKDRDRGEAVSEKSSNEKRTPFDQGEDLFDRKDWRKAIIAYQRYRDQFPKGKMFAEATYKIGVCFQELGMTGEARTFYDELIKKFPNTQEAKRAKIRLNKLK